MVGSDSLMLNNRRFNTTIGQEALLLGVTLQYPCRRQKGNEENKTHGDERHPPAGILNEREVWDALTSAALSAGLTETETQVTIRSGINAGKLQPRGAQ